MANGKTIKSSIQTTIIDILRDVAPEIELESDLDPDVNLREQVDLDSMDFLNFITGLAERFQIDILEKDYGILTTLNEIAKYIHDRQNAS